MEIALDPDPRIPDPGPDAIMMHVDNPEHQNWHPQPQPPVNVRNREQFRARRIVNQRANIAGRRRRNRVHFVQKYKYIWQLQPDKRRWLRCHPETQTRARCIICNVFFNAHLRTIRDHAASQRHQRNMERLGPDDNIYMDEETFRRNIATIKITLAAFFAKHNLPFLLIDELLPLMIKLSEKVEALRETTMKRTTFTKIAQNVLAVSHKRDVFNALCEYKFSIKFDESTDICSEKHGCIIVEYFNAKLNKIMSSLWNIVPIYNDDDEESEATAEGMYQTILNSFDNFNTIPRENLIAFSSDGCTTMVGRNNSVAQKFRRDFPGLVNISCPCHAAHLCASYAAREIPKEIVEFPRDLYNFLKTPKRKHLLKQYQINLEYDVLQLLRPVQTRWLSMGPCIKRVEHEWEPIQRVLAHLQNENATATTLHERINDPITKCYMNFFNYILPTIENLNGWMQTEKIIIPELYNRIKEAYTDILDCVLQQDYLEVTDISEVNLDDEDNLKPLNQINIGERAEESARELDQDQWEIFMRYCRQYFITMAKHISERLEIVWRPYQLLCCFLPTNALSDRFHVNNPTILNDVAALVPRTLHDANFELTLENVLNEWDDMLHDMPEIDENLESDSFWHLVSLILTDEGLLRFRSLSKFALNVLSIPHCNAQPERAWSEERLIKTRLRNRITLKTLNALMMIIDHLKINGCYKNFLLFEPTDDMIRMVLNRSYNLNGNNNENDDDDDDDDDLEEGDEERPLGHVDIIRMLLQ